jgi:hypothetical protein
LKEFEKGMEEREEKSMGKEVCRKKQKEEGKQMK